MKLTNKTMIIIWHWEELREMKKARDEIYLLEKSNCKIVRMNDKMKWANMEKAIKEYVNGSINEEIILFWHRASVNEKKIASIKKELKGKLVDIIPFGEGGSFIYFDFERKAGLIRNPGFPNNDTFYEKDIWGKVHLVHFSVAKSSEDGKTYKIIDKFFDGVWQYYREQPKKYLFEFFEKLRIHLIEMTQIKEIEKTNLAFLINNDSLSAELNNLKNEKLWELKLFEFYEANSKIISLYRKLHEKLNQEFTNPNLYFNELRENFVTLINTMPEKIYD
jgi:hypothetical protein